MPERWLDLPPTAFGRLPGPLRPIDWRRATRPESLDRGPHGDQAASAQAFQAIQPAYQVHSTTRPNAMRYQAKGTKLCVEM